MAFKKKCSYQFEDSTFCPEPRQGRSNLCFFHDSKIAKDNPQARKKILSALQQGKKLEGAQLERADLSHAEMPGAYLVKANLKGANFERSNLEKAHLYGAHLHGANLFNANLAFSNLKETHLEKANLLEMKIDGAKLLGIQWGAQDKVKNELEGEKFEKARNKSKGKKKYREAEEIYRNLSVHLSSAGIYEDASHFLYREMVVRRKQMPLFSIRRFCSKSIDLLCGYGEKTYRILLSAAALIFFISWIHYLAGVRLGEQLLRYDWNQTFQNNFSEYFACLYFSVVSFTTRGFGDITPFGLSRFAASLEAFIGAFMIALFVLTFVRKMIR